MKIKITATINNSKYLIGYSDEVIRPLVFKFPKMSGYVKSFEDKDEDEDKNEN